MVMSICIHFPCLPQGKYTITLEANQGFWATPDGESDRHCEDLNSRSSHQSSTAQFVCSVKSQQGNCIVRHIKLGDYGSFVPRSQ